MNEFDDKAIDEVWDASCWPLRVIVRGDYEYTLVKHPYEFFSDENPIVEGPTPPNDWEACSFQYSIPSPLDGAARAQFRLDARIANAQINDEVGGDFMRPKECFDCECLYADLNEYLVYRRRKVQP